MRFVLAFCLCVWFGSIVALSLCTASFGSAHPRVYVNNNNNHDRRTEQLRLQERFTGALKKLLAKVCIVI